MIAERKKRERKGGSALPLNQLGLCWSHELNMAKGSLMASPWPLLVVVNESVGLDRMSNVSCSYQGR